MPRTPSVHRLAALAALAAVVLLGGCADENGGGDGGGGGKDFADLSGQEISDAAKEDMLTLESMTYEGNLTSDGQPLALHVQASADDGPCTGSMEFNGGKVELLAADGGNWYRPDEAFWRANAPDQADQIIATVGDKWVVDTSGEFGQFCDLTAFLEGLFQDEGDATYENTGTDEIDGQEVVKVVSRDQDGAATGFVLVEGEHYVLRIERTEGTSPGELVFSAFNEEVIAEAPAEDEQVDLSTMQ